MASMDDVLRRALEGLERAKALQPPPGPIVLSDGYLRLIYLRLIERAEALPQNRPGTDKTWTERVLGTWKEVLRSIREVHPT